MNKLMRTAVCEMLKEHFYLKVCRSVITSFRCPHYLIGFNSEICGDMSDDVMSLLSIQQLPNTFSTGAIRC